MTAALPALATVSIPSLAMNEEELLEVLANSIYPGAALASIKMALGYCRGVQKDPLKRVVHIVPMDVQVKKPQGGTEYVKRDVIMEGIASYRMDAARTGQHAGTSKPIFGPMQKLEWESQGEHGETTKHSFEYPEWCEITVTRLVDGKERQFTALEYWLENYASKGREAKEPNKMWRKRSRGQLAKCAEAQALRKGFPDTVSSAPTMEEMEGKTIDAEVIKDLPQIEQPKGSVDTAGATGTSGEAPTGTQASAEGNGSAASKDDPLLQQGAKDTITRAMERYGRTLTDLVAAKLIDAPKDGAPASLEAVRFSQMPTIMKWLRENPAQGAS